MYSLIHSVGYFSHSWGWGGGGGCRKYKKKKKKVNNTEALTKPQLYKGTDTEHTQVKQKLD